MGEVLARRLAQWERQLDISPHDSEYDASFAALPNVEPKDCKTFVTIPLAIPRSHGEGAKLLIRKGRLKLVPVIGYDAEV